MGQLPFRISKRATAHHLQKTSDSSATSLYVPTLPFKGFGDDIIICDIGLDTIYHYSSRSRTITPLFSKIPALQAQDYPQVIVEMKNYTESYVTFSKLINSYNFETKERIGEKESFIYDQKKKTFYQADFTLGLGKVGWYYRITDVSLHTVLPKNTDCIRLRTEYLVESFKEGNITHPALNEIVSNLNEDDNDVLVLIHDKP